MLIFKLVQLLKLWTLMEVPLFCNVSLLKNIFLLFSSKTYFGGRFLNSYSFCLVPGCFWQSYQPYKDKQVSGRIYWKLLFRDFWKIGYILLKNQFEIILDSILLSLKILDLKLFKSSTLILWEVLLIIFTRFINLLSNTLLRLLFCFNTFKVV